MATKKAKKKVAKKKAKKKTGMTEKEVLEIIEEASRDGRTEVDLSAKGNESLPGEIGRLRASPEPVRTR